MKLVQWIGMFFCLVMLNGSSVAAEPEERPIGFLPTEALHANWAFSGVVTTETGENYGYFFQMKRDGSHFHAIAALVDGQTKSLVLFEESEALLHDIEAYNWHVGRAFLRFNPINDSWIFGLQHHDRKGFNFKVDMLKQADNRPSIQDLRQGVELLVSQTSHLNGHIELGDVTKEQFVTAKNAWFRQVWLSSEQAKMYPFTGVLCRFNDGSGFYSMNMNEADAIQGALAGFRDEQGISSMMSQFVNVNQEKEKGSWHIRIASPNLHLVLSDIIQKDGVVAAGFVNEGKVPGFCMVSKEEIGNEA